MPVRLLVVHDPKALKGSFHFQLLLFRLLLKHLKSFRSLSSGLNQLPLELFWQHPRQLSWQHLLHLELPSGHPLLLFERGPTNQKGSYLLASLSA